MPVGHYIRSDDIWWFWPVAGIVFTCVVYFACTLDLSRVTVTGMSSSGDQKTRKLHERYLLFR